MLCGFVTGKGFEEAVSQGLRERFLNVTRSWRQGVEGVFNSGGKFGHVVICGHVDSRKSPNHLVKKFPQAAHWRCHWLRDTSYRIATTLRNDLHGPFPGNNACSMPKSWNTLLSWLLMLLLLKQCVMPIFEYSGRIRSFNDSLTVCSACLQAGLEWQTHVAVQSTNSGARLPGCESWSHHLQPVLSRASDPPASVFSSTI